MFGGFFIVNIKIYLYEYNLWVIWIVDNGLDLFELWVMVWLRVSGIVSFNWELFELWVNGENFLNCGLCLRIIRIVNWCLEFRLIIVVYVVFNWLIEVFFVILFIVIFILEWIE